MAFNTENVTPYERSSQTFERRRSLFPQNYVDSDDESDLGCISALSNSSFDEDEDVPSKTSSNFEDYDIIGIVRKDIRLSPRSTPDKECPAFTIEESYTNIPYSPLASTSKEVSLQTSPSYNLKTPHDTVTMNSKLPRLTHKSVTDSTASKRKLSPYNSPELSNKSLKIDIRNSRVRTTLFPEIDLFLPTKKFYSNTDPIINQSKELKKQSVECLMEQKDETKKLPLHGSSVYITRRNTSKRKNVGKINAGVGHKIRKPKQKRNSLLPLSKCTMTEKESNALKYYLENLNELKSSNIKSKLIENKENSSPDVSVLLTNMECSTTQFDDNFTSATQSFTKMASNSSNSFNTTSMSYGSQYITHNISSTSQNYTTQLGKNPTDTNLVFTSNFGASQPVTNCLSTNVAVTNTIDVPISSELSKKRPLSPTAEEPDQSKKFFKFSRAHKGVVTLNKSMKLSVNHGRISLMGRSSFKKIEQQKQPNFEPEDFTVEEPVMSKVVMDNILTTLEDQELDLSTFTESQNRTSFAVHTSNDNASSFAPRSNSAPTSNPANLILSPISQMCDVTSGLALDSPKRVKNLSSLMENVTRSPKKRLLIPPKENSVGKKKMLTLAERKLKKLHKDQMLLDAGQKNFGVTQCTECNFVYHMGDPSDEACHINYHEAVPVLKFAGWKNERIASDFHQKGRVIQIKPGDPKLWWKRASDLMEVINREMGCYNMEFNLENSQVYLYIKSRSIIGCIVAVQTNEGYRMLSTRAHETDLCSERSFPVKCGVARIWVSHNFRKQGIGTALMNVLKKNFLFGYVMNNSEIAFSSPTEMGKTFAKKYFNTSNFMVFFP